MPPVPSTPAPLSRYLPVRAVHADRIERADGVSVAVLEVRPTEMELTPPLERIGLLGGFAAFLNSLDGPVQFLVRLTPPDLGAYLARLQAAVPHDATPPLRSLADGLEAMVSGLQAREGMVDRRFYLVLPGPRVVLGRPRDGGLDERVAQVTVALRRMGLASVWLSGDALRSFWAACLTGTTTLPASSSSAPDSSGSDLVLEVGPRRLRINGQSAVGLGLERWPRFAFPGWLTAFLTLGVPLDLALHVAPEDAASSVRRLEWKRIQMESSRTLALKRGREVGPEVDLALEDLSRLRDNLQRGRERLFLASLHVLVRGDSDDAAARRARQLRAHAAGSLAALHAPPLRQRQAHLATLPLALNSAGAWKRVDTSTLACLFPFSPPDLDSRRGVLFGLDVRSGCPVILDPFEESSYLNANAVVLAQSGAGKSYAVKLLMLRNLLQGVVHYVIDPEGEYARLAEAAGGRVLRPGVPGQGLNPFAVRDGDAASLAYKVGALRRLLEVMLGQRLSPEERAELDGALTDYYGTKPDRPAIEGFYAFIRHRTALAALVKPFVEGSHRFLLGGGEALDGREACITVFDLSHLDPDLRPAVSHLCAEAVWSQADRTPRPRVLVIDEAWALLQHPEGAAFLSGVTKRARKHRLGVVAVTQDVQDLLDGRNDQAISGHSGRTLVQNSAFKLLLRQDAAAMAQVEGAFHLGPSEREWLLSCGRGEGLLITPAGRALLRIESTPEEHRLLTSATITPTRSPSDEREVMP